MNNCPKTPRPTSTAIDTDLEDHRRKADQLHHHGRDRVAHYERHLMTISLRDQTSRLEWASAFSIMGGHYVLLKLRKHSNSVHSSQYLYLATDLLTSLSFHPEHLRGLSRKV